MGQCKWTYLDDFGKQYKVGLYHGEESGHLMLYVDTRIVLIDFSVNDSKNYSLFLGEELCDLILEKKDGRFSYGLKPNTRADTALNRLRRRKNIYYNIQTMLVALVLLSIIFAVSQILI